MDDTCWNQVLELFRRAIICPVCRGKDVDYLGFHVDGEFIHFRCNKCRHSYYPNKMTPGERKALHIRFWTARVVCGECTGDNPQCPILKEEGVSPVC